MVRRFGNIWFFLAKAGLFIVMLSVFFIGQNLYYEQTIFYFWGNYVVLLLYAASLYFTCKIYQGFHFGNADWQSIILSWVLCLIITNALEYLQLSLLQSRMLPVGGLCVILAVQLALITPITYLIDKLYYSLHPAHRAIIIYGEEKKAAEYSDLIEKHHRKYLVGSVISQDMQADAIKRQIRETESVFLIGVSNSFRESLLEYCFLHDKRVYILPLFSDALLNTAEIAWVSNSPMFLLSSPALDPAARLIKRCMDVIVSLLAIVLLSWLMLIIWIAIRLYDRSPAIYKQIRVTKGGKNFTLYKFRSMRPDAESDGVPRMTAHDDKRVTPVGRVIRRTRFDELPQFFNVLNGSMSLVGPRPERPEIAKQYEDKYPSFSLRTKMKAGITGYAQIYGKYDLPPDEKLVLDIMYIERFSIWQDIKLMLQTLKVILIPTSTEGIPQDLLDANERKQR